MTHPVLIDALLERYEFPPHDGSPLVLGGFRIRGDGRPAKGSSWEENVLLHPISDHAQWETRWRFWMRAHSYEKVR